MLWGIRPVEQQAAYGLAVEGLRRQIHIGLIMPGERLPAERQLAEKLEVSRVTLREALRILETEGYLTVRRGVAGGAFVVGEEDLRSLVLRRIGRDPAAIMRAFEFLSVNARIAARFAAVRRTPSHLRIMRRAADDIEHADSPSLLRRAETLLQMTVAEATQNVFLAHAIEEAWAATFAPKPPGAIQTERHVSREIAAELVDAIEERSEDRAEAAIVRALERDSKQISSVRRSR
ncbi:GntR family transcriptional regulator [Mesorhizobium sp. CA8]|uniref:FadR/GntR family transcriptional regulator n=1 Tax=unclassified Mesorhizobium TaxID=325217 RepID=UPI001CCFBB25|nr:MULTISPECIES: GntR family transcriptional regulator [unclassified Mesorhizobium]MBZ9761689.1 GntR family transcriptional regulator [Mesorhizobium sp. CA8]MBZ9820557.1 GntR family transcriptional regulator [Mesorhizobium sp. CA4]